MVSRIVASLSITLAFTLNASAQNCNCKTEFSFLRNYIEKNYPGFADKTPTYDGLDYQKVTTEFEEKAGRENNNTYCLVLMKEWLKYFKDYHLQIANSTTLGNDSMVLAERIKNREVIKISAATVKKIKEGTGVEGVYYQEDSAYKVAIIKSPNSWRDYAAVILESRNKNWTKGMVKFELKNKESDTVLEGKSCPRYASILYMGNHGVYTNKVMIFNGYSLDNGSWKKEGLKESAEAQAARDQRIADRKNNPQKNEWNYLEFNKPDSSVAYLRVSTFDRNVVYEIDSFVSANNAEIVKTPYLIIDLRGNGGGADRCFLSLMKYIYTKPIITPGISLWSTMDNIEAERFTASLSSSSDDLLHVLQEEAREMQKNIGHFSPATNDTFVQNTIRKYPKKIVVLVDGKCAGSTEQFLLNTKQSTKVTIMGQTTDGALDYAYKRPKPFPCIPFTLEYPIARSARLPGNPVDNIGIMPDIVLSDGTDWLQKAIEFLKTGK